MNTQCPLCDADAFRPVWRWNEIHHGCCRQCGHVYSASAAPSIESYSEFRQHYPDAYLLDEQNPLFELARHRAVTLGGQAGRVLEIGCAYGHFLSLLRRDGWTAEGIEPSTVQSDFARSRFGLSVVTGSYGETSGADLAGRREAYDLIVAFHVLEHLENTRDFLRNVRDDLRPGGRLAIAVPNLETLPRDFNELFFIARGWHRHTFHPRHLIALLESEGFEVLQVGDEPSTRMSPSSYLVIAKSSGLAAKDMYVQTNGCDLVKAFHSDMDVYRDRVLRRLVRWNADGKSVAFFGGGLHTKAVLTLCSLGKAHPACIIDDDAGKQGQTLLGVPIVSKDSDQADACQVIVVSTLAAEQRLRRILRTRWPHKEVYGFYDDLIQGHD